MTSVALGSISAALSRSVFVPSRVRGMSAGSFPEQRLEIEPGVNFAQKNNKRSNVIAEDLDTHV